MLRLLKGCWRAFCGGYRNARSASAGTSPTGQAGRTVPEGAGIEFRSGGIEHFEFDPRMKAPALGGVGIGLYRRGFNRIDERWPAE